MWLLLISDKRISGSAELLSRQSNLWMVFIQCYCICSFALWVQWLWQNYLSNWYLSMNIFSSDYFRIMDFGSQLGSTTEPRVFLASVSLKQNWCRAMTPVRWYQAGSPPYYVNDWFGSNSPLMVVKPAIAQDSLKRMIVGSQLNFSIFKSSIFSGILSAYVYLVE